MEQEIPTQDVDPIEGELLNSQDLSKGDKIKKSVIKKDVKDVNEQRL